MSLFPASARARISFAALLMAFCCLPAMALDMDGFMPEKGHGSAALTYNVESYDEFWVGKTKVSEPMLGEIENRSTSLWLTWGLSDDLALVLSAAQVSSEADGPAALDESGLQDLALLVKWRFWQGWQGDAHHSLVAGAGVRTPLSDYLANGPVSIGDGTTDALVRLTYQLEVRSFFFSQQVGVDLRGGEAPNGFPLLTQAGVNLGRVTLSAGYYRYVANDGTDIGQAGFTFPSNRDETERLSAKVLFRVNERWGVQAGAFNTLDGRNSGDADGLFAGLTFGF